jgi:hypothetical protein
MVDVLQARSVTRLTIESRQVGRDDQRTIVNGRAAKLLLLSCTATVRGRRCLESQMVTWAVGAGGR